MHETKSKMYAWNYVVPWHHTYSGYATVLTLENVCAYYRQLIAWVPIILHLLACAFYPLQCNNKSLQGLVIK